MSFIDKVDAAKRVVLRETLGRQLRAKVAQADHFWKIAELVNLRAERPNDPLQPEDFKRAASLWGVDPAAIHALADAESAGAGFEPDGRAVILVEPHAFSEATLHAFDVSHPHVSYPIWVPYKKGAKPPAAFDRHPYLYAPDDRWALFTRMAELHIEGACSALSVGRFQQLVGRTPAMARAGIPPHWKSLGFPSAEVCFRFLCQSEFDQLEVLRRYIAANGLKRALKERDWRAVARGYNGSGQVDAYSAKMATAYAKRARLYA